MSYWRLIPYKKECLKVAYYSFDELKQPNFKLFWKMFQDVSLLYLRFAEVFLPFYGNFEQFKQI